MSAADAPSDPLSGAGFDALFVQQIEPQLRVLEADRQKAMRISLLIWAGFAVLLVIEGLTVPDFRLLGFSAIAGFIIGYIPLHSVGQKAKQKVISTLCAPLGVSYDIKPTEPAIFQRLLNLKLLPRPDDKSFEDMFQGRRGQSDFMLCEATLSQGSGKSRHTVFQGQIFKIAFPRRFLGTTVVLRDSGWLNRFECPKGLEKVGLEDPHFEKIWEVFGDDQIEARAILTPVFMEQLVALETAYSGKHIRCAFCEGELMIAVEGQDRFEVGNMFTTLDSRARAIGLAGDISAVFKLIDAFVAA
jgi:hypothetical protein